MSSAWGAPAEPLPFDDSIPPVPTPATRLFSFTAWTNANPSKPQPGDKLDQDFDNSNSKINNLQQRLALIQRDDGKLANGAVGLDSISPEAMQQIVDAAAGVALDEAQTAATVATEAATAAQASADAAAAIAQAMPPLPATPGEAVIVAATGTAYITQKALLVDSPGAPDTFTAEGMRITNLAAPVVAFDAANKDYVDTAVTAAGGVPVPTMAGRVLSSTGSNPGDFDWLPPEVNAADLAAINAALANKVDATRAINAGVGLTGGGDLSSDRELRMATMPAGTVKTNLTAGVADPSDVSLAALAAAMPPVEGGKLLKITVITAVGANAFMKLAETKYVTVWLLSGAGGAGSVAGGASMVGKGGNGSGGGGGMKRLDAADLAASETVTIGDGGNGATAAAVAAGSDGGTTSFGAHFSVTGGKGGNGNNGGVAVGTFPSQGGDAVGADISWKGDPGGIWTFYASVTGQYMNGKGGGPLAGPVTPGPNGVNQAAVAGAANSGAGASGAHTVYNAATPILAGAKGGSGKAVIWEFG